MSTNNILSEFGEEDHVEVLVEDFFIEEYQAPFGLPADVLLLSLDGGDGDEQEPITKREGRRGRRLVRLQSSLGLVAAAAFAAAAWCFLRAVTGRRAPRFARFGFAG